MNKQSAQVHTIHEHQSHVGWNNVLAPVLNHQARRNHGIHGHSVGRTACISTGFPLFD